MAEAVTPVPNAVVEYLDVATGKVVAREEFYDPGLDLHSDYTRFWQRAGRWSGLHLAYCCGVPLDKSLSRT